MKIPVTGQTYTTRSHDVSAEKCVNWYLEPSKRDEDQFAMYPTPGLTRFGVTVGIGPIRAQYVFGEYLYVVSNNTLYQVDKDGVSVVKGTLNTTASRISIKDNGTQIMFVDGTNGYIYNTATDTFSTITDTEYPDTATHVDFIDGYFIVNDPSNTGRWYISASYDGLAWDGTDFATAERGPDKLKALIVPGREIWLIGEQTTEIWYSSGSLDFPFAPIQGGYITWGTSAPHSPSQFNRTVLWLARNEHGDNVVVQTKGYSVQIISTDGINQILSTFSTVDDAFSYIYQYSGHVFYVLTFPTEQRTLVYDLNTQQWHEWATKDIGRHRSNAFTYFSAAKAHIVGDYDTGNLYKLDWTKYTDDGTPIIRERQTQHIHADNKYVFFRAFELGIESGVGDFTTEDPQIMLKWSDDGGHTWSNEYWRSMGKIGEYNKRCIWRKQGRSQDRIYNFQVSDPVKAVITNGYAHIQLSNRELD